eukprot:g1367.t1
MSFLRQSLKRTLRTGSRFRSRNVQAFHTSAWTSADAAADASTPVGDGTQVSLNFTTPYETVYEGANVDLVIVPSVTGTAGFTAGHNPTVAQLQPGVIEIFHKKDDKEPEKYFVPGGFAFIHANHVCDITAVDVSKLEDLDGAAAATSRAEAQKLMDAAQPDSPEKAEAQIQYDTAHAICTALGVQG